MRRAFRFLIVAVVLGAVVECGGESTQHSEPRPRAGRVPDRPPSAEALALAEAQCAYLERCDPDAMFLFPENLRAACEELFACAASSYVPWEREGSTFDGCIESLHRRDCPDALDQPLERLSASVTSFPWGPDCGVPTYDDPPPPDAPSVGEACIPIGELEAGCVAGSFCASGTRTVAGRYQCGTCERRLEVGAPCQSGDHCIENTRCANGECRPIRPVGESCEFDGECRFDSCIDSVCAPSQYTATPFAEAVGRDCEYEGDCGNQAALICEDGICSPLPEEGEPCAHVVTLGHPACRLGHACVDGRCLALGCRIDVGEPCSGLCNGDALCDDGVCVAPPGVGEACATWCLPGNGDECVPLCGSGLRCVEGLCVVHEKRENGGGCDFDRDCVSGFCERDLFDTSCDSLLSCPPPCGECGVCTDPPTAERCE